MPERTSRSSRGADPLLEFPSEGDLVQNLTRRLRTEPIVLAPSSLLSPVPSQTAAKPEASVRGPFSTEPLIKPAPRPPVAAPSPKLHEAPPPRPDQVDSPKRRVARPVRIAVGVGLVAGLVAATGAYATIGSNSSSVVAPSAAPVIEGSATITSRPDGAQVLVDGVDQGLTPLALSLPFGEYRLELIRGDERVSLPLDIRQDTAVSAHVELAGLVEPAATPANRRATGPTASPVVGWVTFDLPVDLLVRENGVVIGTTAADRLMLSAGRHELELASEALEFRAVVNVTVSAGQTASTTVSLPRGTLAVSAWPWAEVLIDGEPVGTTPLGSLSVPIGRHEVVWRHPQFGERQETVTVAARTPARVGIDFYRE